MKKLVKNEILIQQHQFNQSNASSFIMFCITMTAIFSFTDNLYTSPANMLQVINTNNHYLGTFRVHKVGLTSKN